MGGCQTGHSMGYQHLPTTLMISVAILFSRSSLPKNLIDGIDCECSFESLWCLLPMQHLATTEQRSYLRHKTCGLSPDRSFERLSC